LQFRCCSPKQRAAIVAADFQIVAAGAGSFESAAVLIQDFEQYSWQAESQPDRRIEHFAGCVADSAASGRAAFATVDFGFQPSQALKETFGQGSSKRSRSIAVAAGPAAAAVDSAVVDGVAVGTKAFVVVARAAGFLAAAAA